MRHHLIADNGDAEHAIVVASLPVPHFTMITMDDHYDAEAGD